MIESFDDALNTLDEDGRVAVFQTIAAISQSKNSRQRELIMSRVAPPIARVVAIFHLEAMQEMNQESKKEELKKRSEPIRESAIAILLTLISTSQPKSKEEDRQIIERSIAMANQIHEHF